MSAVVSSSAVAQRPRRQGPNDIALSLSADSLARGRHPGRPPCCAAVSLSRVLPPAPSSHPFAVQAVCSLGLQGPAVRVSPSIRERSPGAGVSFKLRRTSKKMGDGFNLILPIKLEQDVQRCHQGQLLRTP